LIDHAAACSLLNRSTMEHRFRPIVGQRRR
jgi:hypothetical protein